MTFLKHNRKLLVRGGKLAVKCPRFICGAYLEIGVESINYGRRTACVESGWCGGSGCSDEYPSDFVPGIPASLPTVADIRAAGSAVAWDSENRRWDSSLVGSIPSSLFASAAASCNGHAAQSSSTTTGMAPDTDGHYASTVGSGASSDAGRERSDVSNSDSDNAPACAGTTTKLGAASDATTNVNWTFSATDRQPYTGNLLVGYSLSTHARASGALYWCGCCSKPLVLNVQCSQGTSNILNRMCTFRMNQIAASIPGRIRVVFGGQTIYFDGGDATRTIYLDDVSEASARIEFLPGGHP